MGGVCSHPSPMGGKLDVARAAGWGPGEAGAGRAGDPGATVLDQQNLAVRGLPPRLRKLHRCAGEAGASTRTPAFYRRAASR